MIREIVRDFDPTVERATFAALRRQHATDADYDEVIEGPTVVRDSSGTARLVYLPIGGDVDVAAVGRKLSTVPPASGIRTGGLPVRSRQFGARPRYPLRTFEYCSQATLARDDPESYAILVDLARRVAGLYEEWRPDLYAEQMGRLAEIRPEYRMVDPFTSGILNFDSALPYHRDGGNFPCTWNAQITFRSGVEGGYFVVPALRLALDAADGSVALLDAQSTVHGVSPLSKVRVDGYRVSCVFYCLKALCNCLAPADEIRRARAKRTEREERRAGLIP